MSNFPSDFDDDTTLPFVNDDITEIGGIAINALRDAVFSLEQNIGLGAAGTTASISERLGISFFPDGTLKPSAITSLGLVTLPITDDQISDTAQISEQKLKLDHRTQDLFNYIRDLANDINVSLGWISGTGSKLAPHLVGALYKHSLNHINVDSNSSNYLINKFHLFRDNTNSYEVINDINDELLSHQWADGSPFTAPTSVVTFNGSVYPATFAHTSSGIFLNTSRFSTIPQTANDLQAFAEFIDSSSIFLYGTRIQNLYSNGISRVSRSSNLNQDGYGIPVVPPTPAIAYLLNIGTSSSPVDDINNGDDIIEFKPTQDVLDGYVFDAQFALVKVGDIIRINYGTFEVPFVIKEKKYSQNGPFKKYVVRIAGKNLQYSANASARIDKPLFNKNKFGILATAAANHSNTFTAKPSLIIGSPRGAQALGVGFNPDQLDSTHYLLYLALYPTGSPQDGYTILPPIDVTGNRGTTPGNYTLDSVVAATNTAFRQAGYNYRFIAFSYNGEFGIMLADSYNNAGFSILSAVVDQNGFYDALGTTINFQNNAVGIFTELDPLGFGPLGANIASPPFMASYGSAEAAQNPTKIFLPLRRNNYYVNGIEREKMTLEEGQALDVYGDGYWVGTILTQNVFPGPSPNGRVNTTYRIPLDLKTSSLKEGKTIVVQSLGEGNLVDFGRFIIQSITFGCSPNEFTDIEVYDSVHATGFTPTPTLGVGAQVAIYFNSDSVSFNAESSTDTVSASPFKRHHEVYIDQDGKTFTHERARFNSSGTNFSVNGVVLHSFSEMTKMDIIKVSPKLRGYQFGSVTKITLQINNYNDSTGFFDGYLASMDDSGSFTHKGPTITGKKGEVVRFYDETNIDYIDILFDMNVAVTNFSSLPGDNKVLDFQLFPTLALDDEIMLIGSCQLNDVNNYVSRIRDERQFGNVSEKEFSTSALDFLSYPERALHGNGVIRGFNIADRGLDQSLNVIPNPEDGQLFLTGGVALVNGKFIQMNSQIVNIPIIKELLGVLYNVNWLLCVNDKSEYQPIPLLDYDPALGTPNNTARVFKAFNVLNGATYSLEGTTFSDAVNNRKDLTPLYVVASTVIPSPASITLEVTDARKYVNDGDTNLPLRLTSANAQGNFKSPVSIFNWIKYNNVFNSTAFVKGADSDTGTIDTDIILDFNSTAIIDGENDALLTMNGVVTIGSNLTLQNLDIIFNGGISIKDNISNLILRNCNITIQVPALSPTDNVIFDIFNGNNILIEDCNITIQYASQYNPAFSARGAAFRLENTLDFKFINSILSISYSINAGVVTPGNVFEIRTSNGVIITDSEFSGNFNQFVLNNNSNGMRLTNVNITSTYNPNAGISADSYNGIAYSTTNLVNNGQGWIYSNVNSTLTDIIIDNVTFNYDPTTLAGAAHRYSFINFNLTTNTSILSNVNITNCKFNNLKAAGSYDDIRAAIAIINSATATTVTSQQPIVSNVKISGNSCNKNQTIIITSELGAGSKMVYPGLASINTVVNNNICGNIGYWISSGSKTIAIQPNVNALSDKTTGINIDNNICHWITNVDGYGKYFKVQTTSLTSTSNLVDYPSGNVIIQNNKANWIHVGISFEESSSLSIVNNMLNAYAEVYKEQFGQTSSTVTGRGAGYAILVTSNERVTSNTNALALGEGEGNDVSCIIKGNTTSAGYWLQTTLTTSVYRYSAGYVSCQGSNIISNNIFKGIEDTVLGGPATPAIVVSGLNNHITNNKIYRNGKSISAYVAFISNELPVWNGVGSNGIITDNYFDSPFINSTTLVDTGYSSGNLIGTIALPAECVKTWIYERNKNQTGFAAISPSNQFAFNGSNGWGPPPLNTNLFTTTMGDATGNQLTGLPWGGFRSQNTMIVDQTPAVPADRFFFAQENIEKYLPNNVRVISLSGGLRPFESLVNYSTSAVPSPLTNPVSSNFWLTISSLNPAVDYTNTNNFATYSSLDSSILELSSPVFAVVTGGQINSTYSNIPFSINLENYNSSDISSNYITGKGNGITVSWVWVWYRTSNTLHITISPIKIKYRW